MEKTPASPYGLPIGAETEAHRLAMATIYGNAFAIAWEQARRNASTPTIQTQKAFARSFAAQVVSEAEAFLRK